MTYTPARNRILLSLTYASLALFVLATLMSFLYPGTEQTMGEVQRIFYIHLGTFFGAFLGFFGAALAGVAYLRSRQIKWDALQVACIEVGLALSAITIVTGAIWARPTWGTYWTWDPRLTSVSIMWLAYAACLFLRSAIEDSEQKRRFSAVYAILAFGSVFLTIIIIRIRPDVIHPVVAGPSVNSDDMSGEFSVTPRIAQTVLFNIFAYVIISATLIWYRIRLENRMETVQAHKMQVLSQL